MEGGGGEKPMEGWGEAHGVAGRGMVATTEPG